MDNDKKERLYHYCIVRNDMDLGVLCAQLVHAAGESNPKGLHANAVVLSVSREKLLEIENSLKEADIGHIAVYEPDPPFNDDITAIGINPAFRSENKDLRRIVAGLKLLR